MFPLLRGDGPALRIGHRGAAALAPENTLDGFARAVAEGVDAIEFDVVGDQIAHDVHTATGLSLDAALEFLASTPALLQIDLKTPGVERELVAALRRHALLERSVVSSFHAEALRALAALEPALPRLFTYPEDRLGVGRSRLLRPAVNASLFALRRLLPRRVPALLENAQAAGLTLHYLLVDARVVETCHARGAAVWTWTPNEREEIARLDRLGTDAIITDDPRLFAGVLRT